MSTTREHQPAKALEVAMSIDWDNLSRDLWIYRGNRLKFISIDALGAKEYETVINLENKFSKDDPTFAGYFQHKMIAAIQLDQIDTVYQLLEEIKNTAGLWYWGKPQYDIISFCNAAAKEYFKINKPNKANTFLTIALDWETNKRKNQISLYDSLELAETYRLLGKPHKAIDLQSSFEKNYSPNWDNYFYLGLLATDYASIGNMPVARQLIETLLKSDEGRWGNWILYHVARVYATMNEKEKAMETLRTFKSIGGPSYSPFLLRNDYYMKNLLDYPPFIEHTKIRDEKIKG